LKKKKTKISASEYLQLIGLKTLANNHLKILYTIQSAMNDLLELKDNDYVGDLVWYEFENIDGILEKLNIEKE